MDCTLMSLQFNQIMKRTNIPQKLHVFIVMCIWVNLPLLAFEQEKEIRGKIFDSTDGLPLSHVSIKVKGADAGVQTNDKGNLA